MRLQQCTSIQELEQFMSKDNDELRSAEQIKEDLPIFYANFQQFVKHYALAKKLMRCTVDNDPNYRFGDLGDLYLLGYEHGQLELTAAHLNYLYYDVWQGRSFKCDRFKSFKRYYIDRPDIAPRLSFHGEILGKLTFGHEIGVMQDIIGYFAPNPPEEKEEESDSDYVSAEEVLTGSEEEEDDDESEEEESDEDEEEASVIVKGKKRTKL